MPAQGLKTFHRRLLTTEQRFATLYRIDTETGCWLWEGGRKNRYGQFWIDGKNLKANRASWIINYGSIPDGFFVCHHCDNPICVNPAHLFLGTAQDNMNDKMRKGRGRNLRGEESPGHKLTVQQVILIRESPLSGVELSRLFSRIRRGLRWRYIDVSNAS